MMEQQAQTQKIRRKRDFSQVVDPTQNASGTYNSGNSAANSPTKMKNNLQNQGQDTLQQYKNYLEDNTLGEN